MRSEQRYDCRHPSVLLEQSVWPKFRKKSWRYSGLDNVFRDRPCLLQSNQLSKQERKHLMILVVKGSYEIPEKKMDYASGVKTSTARNINVRSLCSYLLYKLVNMGRC